jgi:hypothetical protein
MSDLPAPQRPIAYVLLGAAVVMTGALTAVMLPPALVGVGLVLAVLRICWLDENIKADLLGAEELPPEYKRTAADPTRLALEPIPEDPALLATGMRGQIQAWAAACLGALAVLVLIHSGWPTTPAVLGAMGLIALGYWQADRLVVTIQHLDRGQALPARHLVSPRAWAHSWRVGPDE